MGFSMVELEYLQSLVFFYHIDQISKIYIAWMQKKRNPIHLSLHSVRI